MKIVIVIILGGPSFFGGDSDVRLSEDGRILSFNQFIMSPVICSQTFSKKNWMNEMMSISSDVCSLTRQ